MSNRSNVGPQRLGEASEGVVSTRCRSERMEAGQEHEHVTDDVESTKPYTASPKQLGPHGGGAKISHNLTLRISRSN